MIDNAIDAVDDFAARFRRPISILAAGWFGISCAAWSGFITLPKLAFLTGMPAIFASSAFNALWWGWLNPRILRRRTERDASVSQNSEATNG